MQVWLTAILSHGEWGSCPIQVGTLTECTPTWNDLEASWEVRGLSLPFRSHCEGVGGARLSEALPSPHPSGSA